VDSAVQLWYTFLQTAALNVGPPLCDLDINLFAAGVVPGDMRAILASWVYAKQAMEASRDDQPPMRPMETKFFQQRQQMPQAAADASVRLYAIERAWDLQPKSPSQFKDAETEDVQYNLDLATFILRWHGHTVAPYRTDDGVIDERVSHYSVAPDVLRQLTVEGDADVFLALLLPKPTAELSDLFIQGWIKELACKTSHNVNPEVDLVRPILFELPYGMARQIKKDNPFPDQQTPIHCLQALADIKYNTHIPCNRQPAGASQENGQVDNCMADLCDTFKVTIAEHGPISPFLVMKLPEPDAADHDGQAIATPALQFVLEEETSVVIDGRHVHFSLFGYIVFRARDGNRTGHYAVIVREPIATRPVTFAPEAWFIYDGLGEEHTTPNPRGVPYVADPRYRPTVVMYYCSEET
jgi:hypothetical protein